jgi:hypothetical protein
VNLVVIWHVDGPSYGPVPNRTMAEGCRSSYGVDAIRHLLIIAKRLG